MAVDVTMLIEDFFGAVDRAFIREANRIPPPRLELRTPSERPLPAPNRRGLPERRRLGERRRSVARWHYALGGETGMLKQESTKMNLSPEFRSLLERL